MSFLSNMFSEKSSNVDEQNKNEAQERLSELSHCLTKPVEFCENLRELPSPVQFEIVQKMLVPDTKIFAGNNDMVGAYETGYIVKFKEPKANNYIDPRSAKLLQRYHAVEAGLFFDGSSLVKPHGHDIEYPRGYSQEIIDDALFTGFNGVAAIDGYLFVAINARYLLAHSSRSISERSEALKQHAEQISLQIRNSITLAEVGQYTTPAQRQDIYNIVALGFDVIQDRRWKRRVN